MTGFGIQYFIYARVGSGPIPGPPWIPGRRLMAYLLSAFLIAAGVCIVIGIKSLSSSMLLGTFLLFYGGLYFPRLVGQPHNPGPWTSSAELLSLCGGAWVLAGIAPPDSTNSTKRNGLATRLRESGRLLFAIPLVVFGIQHFLYAGFVATLIPGWIPGRLFWAYFVGVAFIAASSAIASKIRATLAAALLGTMFLSWVLILHAPRVAAATGNGNEWTSALVALGMSGAAFIVAGALTGPRESRSA